MASPGFLAAWLPSFRLDRCGWDPRLPAVLVRQERGAERVVALSPVAAAGGVKPGMTLAEARSHVAEVQVERLARLQDTLGDEVVCRVEPVDAHLPEAAWRAVPDDDTPVERPTRVAKEDPAALHEPVPPLPARPVILLAAALPVRVAAAPRPPGAAGRVDLHPAVRRAPRRRPPPPSERQARVVPRRPDEGAVLRVARANLECGSLGRPRPPGRYGGWAPAIWTLPAAPVQGPPVKIQVVPG